MSELAPDAESASKPILDLLVSAGYTQNSSVSDFDNVTAGIIWCINATGAHITNLDPTRIGDVIEAALKSMGCPYSLHAHQVHDLEFEAVYFAAKWLVGHLPTLQVERGTEASLVHEIEEEESNLRKLNMLLLDEESSVKLLHDKIEEEDRKKIDFINETRHLFEKISEEGADTCVQELTSLLKLLKNLEKKESDFRSSSEGQHFSIEDVNEMESKLCNSNERKNNAVDLDDSLAYLLEKLNSAKNELAAKFRASLLLRRKVDDVPSQSELIQYEHRFSELYAQIQEKHRQTRKCYTTYNALLEIKELMLKEISLLNSICSQFEDAMNSTAGRSKLVESMERIVKGTRQKLEKVELGLQSEWKNCNILKENYAMKVGEQRRQSYLLKAFQDECARGERLQSLRID